MKTIYAILIGLILFPSIVNAQNNPAVSPCSEPQILARHLENNPNALLEIEENEKFTKAFVKQLVMERAQTNAQQSTAQYTIPVVLHVFHNGDDGKIDLDQAQSGIDILNDDFNGLNTDWNTIDPEFDSIKGILDIQFCLASLDPNGDSTTGVIYYEDSLAMLNIPDLFIYAWDNYKYLNIYLPKYTGGGPSLFTAYAYYPNTTNTNNNRDGIFYSSIRWGYGTHSELALDQDWASVGTHEVGHWINLRHTFENGCSFPGDYVDDTPPTTGGAIELSGCLNNDQSCSVSTNGENYMDYNHDCKKMFTQGQVDRMTAALSLPSRIMLWSQSNLQATGCALPPVSFVGLNATYCTTDTVVTLTGTPAGGTFSGTGITGNQFDPSSAGIGSHTITYSFPYPGGNTDSTSLNVDVSVCTGIKEDHAISGLQVFPNPNSGLFTIEFNLTGMVNTELKITDILGQIVYRENLTHSSGKHKKQINLNKYRAGVYCLQLVTEQGVLTKKVIIE